MKKILILSLAFFFAFVLSAKADEAFVIDNFHSDIQINEDSSFTVTETIDINFSMDRHGIFRDLDTQGIRVKIKEVLNQNNDPWNYTLESFSEGTRIRIGDADKYISGNQTYKITYDISKGIRFFDEHDELYWNVTGNFWPTSIANTSATVYLPTGTSAGKVTCYTGSYGTSEQDCKGEISGNTAEFTADRSFGVNEGLSIVVGIPKGALIEPITPWWLSVLTILGIIALVLIAVEPIINFYRKGRDPRGRGTIIPQYEPPDKLTPVLMGSLWDERADMRDITSTLIDLAVRGFLKIKKIPGKKWWIFNVKNEDYELIRQEPEPGMPKELSEFESRLLKDIFGSIKSKKISSLKNKFYTKLPKLKEILYDELIKREYFPKSPQKIRTKYVVKGIFVLFIGVIFFILNIIILPSALIINGILTLILANFMPQKTEKGVLAYEHIKGFKMYLNTAEKYRVKFQEKQHLFYEFLPYAMTFGIAKKWSKAFGDIFEKPPEWYEGDKRTFHLPVFVNNLNGISSQIKSSFASRPGGSSGGGSGFSGGFSGGGFGGGGGGSW